MLEQEVEPRGGVLGPGLLIGVGLGGFVDGIVLGLAAAQFGIAVGNVRRPHGYAENMGITNVVLNGGPFDNTRFDEYDEADGPLIEVESEGLIHRYTRTTTTRAVDGEELPVFQFDGTVSPDGGLPGTENPRDRLASPLADELNEDR